MSTCGERESSGRVAEAPAHVARIRDLAQRIRQHRRVPLSTYRIQFHSKFGFDHARTIVPYLSALGITDCYSSPYLKARSASLHGYDICDHNALNSELGSEADYDAFVETLREHGLGQVLDFVPNHMGIDPRRNRWWRDVLENGSCSPFARFFDVDWDPITPELKGKVLLPILGDQYGRALERGELRLRFDDGALLLEAGGWELPINPRQSPQLFRFGLDELQRATTSSKEEECHVREFLSILMALRNLPARAESNPEHIDDRQREKEVARERLARLVEASPRIRRHIDENVRIFNGVPGNPASFDLLHELLEGQAYRLSYWRTASHEINYRRFFDVNDLACLRMEDPAVFDATHQLIVRLIGEGKVTGLRIDHMDGLFDAGRYTWMLQESVARAWLVGSVEPEPVPPDEVEIRRALESLREERGERGLRSGAVWVTVEKILAEHESLPDEWPIDGTTGYDYLNLQNGLFVEARNARVMRQTYERFTGIRTSFAQVAYDCKKLILSSTMASELNMLANALSRIAERERRSRDFTLDSLRDALKEIVACFPTYRTYVTEAGWTATDRRTIESAVALAKYRSPTMEVSIFDFIRGVLLPDRGDLSPQEFRDRLRFAMKLQQYTGPIQAKGVEDTAFYRFNLLMSLNEVGGDPRRFGTSPTRFHEENGRRLEMCPHSVLATSTHDTKRGEDARTRIDALSEIPEQWRRAVSRWARLNSANRTKLEDGWAPDRNDEYLFYQTLVGCWPASATAGDVEELAKRIGDYMLKAIREAKVHTSWINENQRYEHAVVRFVERTLKGRTSPRFFDLFRSFHRQIAQLGMVNSLAQVVLKIASPGVPDFYQGTELWALDLVDPDNRRPVDYGDRCRLLRDLESILERERSGLDGTGAGFERVGRLLEGWEDGRIKLHVTACGLHLRRRHADLFSDGDYLPMEVRGDAADRVVAFARRGRGGAVVVAVPVRVAAMTSPERPFPIGMQCWGTTTLVFPVGLRGCTWRDTVSGEVFAEIGEEIPLGTLLSRCPVAMLEQAGESVP
ncbi:MAG: malto-oligosyltrehalose synthase [Planctomycetes bacterium]|nr:malto-oligosyltrehalose synthase [Planctomycetota bacterium]MBI3844853.1 malto-oligosyltrehalose synthase [Planctomycetota bacterium]